jgi:hypothetical protein
MQVYELKISPKLNNDAEVDWIALVDEPAIEKDFLAFRNEFINPNKGEKHDEFISRCMSYVVGEGKDKEQAYAICESMWQQHFSDEKIQELGTKENTNNLIEQVAKMQQQFKIVNEDQHIISGALMLADKLIYRNNEKFGEHYVKFSADTIKQIAIKFAQKGYQSNVNLMHDPEQRVTGVTMFESFIVDSKRGIKPMEGFEDAAEGSWFGSFYVDNPEIWDKIKSGEFRGFSVEGMFDYTDPVSEEQNKLNELQNILNEINDYDEAFKMIKELLMK